MGKLHWCQDLLIWEVQFTQTFRNRRICGPFLFSSLEHRYNNENPYHNSWCFVFLYALNKHFWNSTVHRPWHSKELKCRGLGLHKETANWNDLGHWYDPVQTTEFSSELSTEQNAIKAKWSSLVIQEFFAQGELEKSQNLSVSMFCDRCHKRQSET